MKLDEAIFRLSSKVAEDSLVFWTQPDRINYINEAQTFISAIVKGVSEIISHRVTNALPYIPLPERFLADHPEGAYTSAGAVLTLVPREVLNQIDPNWRVISGYPKWYTFDSARRRAVVIPKPKDFVEVELAVSVLPAPLSDMTSALFNGQAIMERYVGATITYAAFLALMKERSEDAPSFFQTFRQELMDLGVSPDQIPPIPQQQGG